jgi:hypothetical protein
MSKDPGTSGVLASARFPLALLQWTIVLVEEDIETLYKISSLGHLVHGGKSRSLPCIHNQATPNTSRKISTMTLLLKAKKPVQDKGV